MRRFLAAAAIAATVILAAPRAHAYTLSCQRFALLVQSGDDSLVSIAVGHVMGVADMLTNLLCYVNDPKCGCMQRLADFDNLEPLVEVAGNAVAQCFPSRPNDSASGAIFSALTSYCRFG